MHSESMRDDIIQVLLATRAMSEGVVADAILMLLKQEAEPVADRLAANTDLLTYVLQDDVHNRLTPRVIDIAYTAFMQAHQPNSDDGAPSDWYNDTKPAVMRAISKLRSDLLSERNPPKPAPLPSGLRCDRCGGDCVEFTIPNSIWNAVIRTDGHERDDEYICEGCWHKALEAHLLRPVASVPQDVEEFIKLRGTDSANLFGGAVLIDDLREWMAGHVRVPVEDLCLLIVNYDFFVHRFTGTIDFDPAAARNRIAKAISQEKRDDAQYKRVS